MRDSSSMNRRVDRLIAEETFDYGNHTIRVRIKLRYTNQYNGQHDIMNGVEGYHYYRFVNVAAYKNEDDIGNSMGEIRTRSSAALDVDATSMPNWRFWRTEERRGVPSLPEHVEYTVRPVLEDLDELYTYTSAETEIDIDVAMDRVEHETSWVEVDDEIDRISAEIDEIADASDPAVEQD